ncbi:DNA mismatch repair protein [Flavobacterium columnare]|uniref:MutS-related protein n=1 Tax=Flavobacterium columnare TaxID=996 RepID=UPI001896752D|nr:DNA mismatch repair protein [Flavobacterium columnare]MBF6654279.1 DNA mismatch repair protein [Flavobacterium columnare]
MKYNQLIDQNTLIVNKLNTKFTVISLMRFLFIGSFLFFSYNYFKNKDSFFLVLGLFSILLFFVLVNQHQKIKWNKKLYQKLILINNHEIQYLEGKDIPFEEGTEYIDSNHFCSFDLDLFGRKSLFQNLNRTATFVGKEKLANLLQGKLSNKEIKDNQEAIKELSQKIEWRQQLLALASFGEDNQEKYEKLIHWADTKEKPFRPSIIFVSYLLPITVLLVALATFLSQNIFFYNLVSTFFIINLLITVSQLKKIKKEIANSNEILQSIKSYTSILKVIEFEKFEKLKLIALQSKLQKENQSASQNSQKLFTIVTNINTVQNVLGAVFVNGFFLYHIHTLRKLYLWKDQFSKEIKIWLQIIGEFEALNSLANFSYNNPNFVFPEINTHGEINFEKIGHPLLQSNKRVCNTFVLKANEFVILTGSNMAGKSTFLRTLGINMVLVGIGAPICSTKANVHPYDVIVSMRQSDSLSDGESYFFAEVKRLKQIVQKLENEVCFVLLDEILKGTNSDDKQNGTIEVIKKIISKKAIGCIATYDLEVCKMSESYENQLFNKCFEVEIIDNELSFDYKLREGICKNKSATFLMKKMGII